jgi:hypothetical protein
MQCNLNKAQEIFVNAYSGNSKVTLMAAKEASVRRTETVLHSLVCTACEQCLAKA